MNDKIMKNIKNCSLKVHNSNANKFHTCCYAYGDTNQHHVSYISNYDIIPNNIALHFCKKKNAQLNIEPKYVCRRFVTFDQPLYICLST